MRTGRSRHWTSCLVVAVVAALAGCADPPETTSAPAPRPASDDRRPTEAEQAAERAALAAYAGYLEASREASRDSDPRHPKLTRFLGDPLLTRVRVAIDDARRHGAVRTGTLTSQPSVTSVSLDGDPPTVEIQDCLDATGYRLVYRKDKRVVPGSAGTRHLATATATRYPDGRWLINSGAAHEDQPC
ncbi:hypothetical protein TPA0907_51470 [Micromonospora humidisoli]|uniref:hypothetical protein n=1 Tax=Micromonospora sp. AKA109 TaxID=2733865 RepID=UPI0022C68841|nr:hypothetical protein [Micromonospora sp. AKA109]GHJ10780.1 hypothetical protein TPA0907_51470 [Micromonospora sp. AKA109]